MRALAISLVAAAAALSMVQNAHAQTGICGIVEPASGIAAPDTPIVVRCFINETSGTFTYGVVHDVQYDRTGGSGFSTEMRELVINDPSDEGTSTTIMLPGDLPFAPVEGGPSRYRFLATLWPFPTGFAQYPCFDGIYPVLEVPYADPVPTPPATANPGGGLQSLDDSRYRYLARDGSHAEFDSLRFFNTALIPVTVEHVVQYAESPRTGMRASRDVEGTVVPSGGILEIPVTLDPDYTQLGDLGWQVISVRLYTREGVPGGARMQLKLVNTASEVPPTPEASATPTVIPSPTPTASPTASPSVTPSVSPTESPRVTWTPEPSATPSPSDSPTPTATPSATPTGPDANGDGVVDAADALVAGGLAVPAILG